MGFDTRKSLGLQYESSRFLFDIRIPTRFFFTGQVHVLEGAPDEVRGVRRGRAEPGHRVDAAQPRRGAPRPGEVGGSGEVLWALTHTRNIIQI